MSKDEFTKEELKEYLQNHPDLAEKVRISNKSTTSNPLIWIARIVCIAVMIVAIWHHVTYTTGLSHESMTYLWFKAYSGQDLYTTIFISLVCLFLLWLMRTKK